MPYVLSCCSTADMPMAYFEKRNIPFVCFHYIMDGKVYPDDLGQTMSFETFYSRIAAGAMPTTSQVNVAEFNAFFEPLLQKGLDILHVTLSSGLSGVHSSACVSAEEMMAKYPGRKVVIVDSLGASSGYGLLIDMATDLRDSGASMDEVRAWLEDNKLSIHHWFFSTDLSHYKRGGRISTGAAIAGTILGICPLLNMSFDGKLISRKKVRGKARVIDEIVNQMQSHALGGAAYSGKCFISNSACYQDARRVADKVEATFPNLAAPVMINSVGTVIGSHTGPGTVALFFVGDKRVD